MIVPPQSWRCQEAMDLGGGGGHLGTPGVPEHRQPIGCPAEERHAARGPPFRGSQAGDCCRVAAEAAALTSRGGAEVPDLAIRQARCALLAARRDRQAGDCCPPDISAAGLPAAGQVADSGRRRSSATLLDLGTTATLQHSTGPSHIMLKGAGLELHGICRADSPTPGPLVWQEQWRCDSGLGAVEVHHLPGAADEELGAEQKRTVLCWPLLPWRHAALATMAKAVWMQCTRSA